jgi:hypothetical protein
MTRPDLAWSYSELNNYVERVGRAYVRFQATLTDAVQVFNGRFLWHLIMNMDWNGEKARMDTVGDTVT